MLLLSKRIPQGQGLAAALLRRAPTLALDWATRQKSRFDALLSSDEHVGVFLPRGHVLRGGDVLVAEDGRLVRVVAADEAVTVVSAPATLNPADAAHALMRGAYHLGNRHVMLSLQSGRLVMEPDAVLGEMLKGLGLEVHETREPFEPEGGAYGDHRSGHEHGHGHGHGHGHHHHDHGDGHGHAHSHQEALSR